MPHLFRHLLTFLATLVTVIGAGSSSAMNAEFRDAAGNFAYSDDFLRDYADALSEIANTGSAAPLHQLLETYDHPNERAELELTLGVIYAQRTGLVSPDKAITHLSRALDFELPDRAYVDALLWRAGAYEQLKKRDDAIRDHLRGLVACLKFADHDIRPELLPPETLFSINPQDEEERQIKADYERYRSSVLLQQHIRRQRGYFAQAIRRLTNGQENNEDKLRTMLETITPDPAARENVLNQIAKG
jgi:tetratricopeptide (TPR) repeat protein